MDRDCIRENWDYLVKNIEAKELIDYLYQCRILNEYDIEKIPTMLRLDGNRHLLSKVERHEHGVRKLFEALRRTDSYFIEEEIQRKSKEKISKHSYGSTDSEVQGADRNPVAESIDTQEDVYLLTFKSSENFSDGGCRFQWLYFALVSDTSIKIRLVLFDDQIDDYAFTMEGFSYKLQNIERTSVDKSAFHKDVRLGAGFAFKITDRFQIIKYSCNICNNVPLPKKINISSANKLAENEAVTLDGIIVYTWEENWGRRNIRTRCLIITDHTRKRIKVRVFIEKEVKKIHHSHINHRIKVEYGIMKFYEMSKEIHVSRFSRIEIL